MVLEYFAQLVALAVQNVSLSLETKQHFLHSHNLQCEEELIRKAYVHLH